MAKKCPKCKSENPRTSTFCADCGTQLPSIEDIEVTETLETPKEELTTGSTFAGRYQIIEELGKGGMGRVYRVLDKELEEEVALKLIKPEIAKDKETIERFKNELKVARRISHRNVGRMYELMEDRGTHFITMEYVPGQDLRGLIRQMGQLTTGKAIAIAKEVCEGLVEAHRQGVVHRDLKPSNIIIDKQGNARILDFGIARSVAGKGITGAGVMIGTPEYMSPEQVEGKEIDQRSDIYSLGIILYEMVTGRVPFEGDTPFTIGVKHKSEIPKDPRELNTQIAEDLSRVILRCLEKNKEKRYQSTGKVRTELANIEKGIPTTERIVPERKPLTSREITVQLNLRKLLIPVLAIFIVIIAAITIWRLFLPKKAVPVEYDKPVVVVMYFDNNTGDESLDQYRKGISNLLTTDLMQSQLINVIREDKLLDILKKLNLEEAPSYSSEDLKKVAAEGRATHILQGNYTKAGENFRFNYTLHDVNTDKVIGSDRVSGIGIDSMFSMVDELTIKIKDNFKLSQQQIASDIDKDIGQITTSSSEAYKYYIEASKFFDAGDYRRAIKLFETATAVDAEFASAYRSMAMAYYNMGYYAEGDKFVQKAFKLSDRVSDRELYRNKAEFYRISEKTYDKSIEAFKELLELYPDDKGGLNNLALVYEDIEEYDKAIELYLLAQEGEISELLPATNLASLYQAMGLFDEAKKVLEDYLEKFEDNASIHGIMANIHLDEGNYDLALQEIEKASILNPTHLRNFRNKGDILFCRGEISNAEREYKKLLSESNPSSNAFGYGRLTRFYFNLGRIEDAKKHGESFVKHAQKMGQKVWEGIISLAAGNFLLSVRHYQEALEKISIAQKIATETENWSLERRALSFKGRALIMMGSFEEAQKTAEELKELCQKSLNKRIIRLHYHLEGLMALENGNYDEAIESIENALSLDPDYYKPNLDLLGMAYYRSGNLDKAITEYEKIINCPSGIRTYEGVYVKSFYMLGKIYEEQGNTAKAIEHYEKFLDLWKDADPGIAEVEDAKKRLATLR
jgi:serine/threonine protein kinase/Flp pilus assembly protein TadD